VNPLSHSPPCQAAVGVADQDAGAAVAAAVSDIAQNFAPTPAFLQLSSTPAKITALYFKYLSMLNVLQYHFMTASGKIMDTKSSVKGFMLVQVVKALCYKPKSPRFNNQWGHKIFHRLNPSSRTMVLGSTQPVKETSSRNISWGVKVAGAQG
jgi:hypothetical protein